LTLRVTRQGFVTPWINTELAIGLVNHPMRSTKAGFHVSSSLVHPPVSFANPATHGVTPPFSPIDPRNSLGHSGDGHVTRFTCHTVALQMLIAQLCTPRSNQCVRTGTDDRWGNKNLTPFCETFPFCFFCAAVSENTTHGRVYRPPSKPQLYFVLTVDHQRDDVP
jgi:hypothetical protein